MTIDRKKVKNVFKKYTDNYDISDEKIKLKVDHTYRVAAPHFCSYFLEWYSSIALFIRLSSIFYFIFLSYFTGYIWMDVI